MHGACGPTGVPGAGGPDSSGRAALRARGRRPARSPSAPRASLGASARSPARPRHRPRAPQPGPPVPPAPFTPETPGVLRYGSVPCLEARLGPAAHGHRSQALRSLRHPPHRPHQSRMQFPATISNVEFTVLKSQRFQTLLSIHPIELHATFEEVQVLPPPICAAAWPRRPGGLVV